jgi:hypothetical protein
MHKLGSNGVVSDASAEGLMERPGRMEKTEGGHAQMQLG